MEHRNLLFGMPNTYRKRFVADLDNLQVLRNEHKPFF